MDPNVKLLPKQGTPLFDPKHYKRLIGKLIYLIITHPYISFEVSVLSQFLETPYEGQWDAAF